MKVHVVCNNLFQFDLLHSFFPSRFFSAGRQTCPVVLFTMLPRGINFSIAKKLPNRNKNGLEHCNIETCTYISFTAIYGLSEIDNMLVEGP